MRQKIISRMRAFKIVEMNILKNGQFHFIVIRMSLFYQAFFWIHRLYTVNLCQNEILHFVDSFYFSMLIQKYQEQARYWFCDRSYMLWHVWKTDLLSHINSKIYCDLHSEHDAKLWQHSFYLGVWSHYGKSFFNMIFSSSSCESLFWSSFICFAVIMLSSLILTFP